MAGFVLRRLLGMIPTFIGITLVGFVIINLAGDPLERSRGTAGVLRDAKLSTEDTAELRAVLGYDKPLLLNLDVEDQRRFVQRGAEELVAFWDGFAPRLRDAASAAALESGEAPTAAAAAAWGVRLLEATVRAREADLDGGGAERAEELLAGDAPPDLWRRVRIDVGGDLQRLLLIQRRAARLAGMGAMTLRHLGPVLGDAEQRPASEAARRLLVAVATAAAGTPLESAAAVEERCARNAGPWSPETLEGQVATWLEAARRLVTIEGALRAEGADPGRDAGWIAAAAALERIAAEMAPAGGLLAAILMPHLLGEGPHVKERGVRLLSACAGWQRPYRAWFRPGEPERRDVAAWQQAADRGLESVWRRERLHYTEIGGLSRALWYSWTDTRYGNWLGNVLRLDFGESLQNGRPVMDLVWERLPTTLFLQICAITLMYLIAIPLGAWSAVRAGTRRERGVTTLLFLFYAAPAFWIATMALYFFASPDHLAWFPLEGLRSPEMITALEQGDCAWWSWAALRDLAWHAVLPIFVLTYGGVCVLSRYGRSGMLEVLREDYVRTARAKGLPERQVILRHALRNGILPLVAFFPAILPALVGGSVVVEMIFGIRGMGLLAWDSARASDVPVAMALITLTAVLTMIGYALADVVYGILNPRTWHQR